MGALSICNRDVSVTAEMQSSEDRAAQFRDLLLRPQFSGISDRLRRDKVSDPDAATELFSGPIFDRWLLRTGPFDSSWVACHVARTVRAYPDGPDHADRAGCRCHFLVWALSNQNKQTSVL